MTPLGILQGRLSRPPAGRPQAFPPSWPDEFTSARASGFDAIEWLITADHIPDNPLLVDGGVAQLLEIRGRTGLRIPSVCADCFITMPLVRVPAAVRAERMELLQHIIARAAEADARVLLLPVLEDNALGRRSEALELIGALRESLALAERVQVTVALESDWRADALVELVDQAGSQALGVYYDVGNATAAGYDPARDIAILTNRIRGVHIKDRRTGGPSVPLGDGDVNFESALDALRRAGYNGTLILETPAGADPTASAVANLAFLRDRIARFQPSHP